MQKSLRSLLLALQRIFGYDLPLYYCRFEVKGLQLIDLRWNTNKMLAILRVSAISIGRWEDMRNYATHSIVDPKSPLWCCPRTLNMEIVGSSVSLSKKLHHASSIGWLSCTTQTIPFQPCPTTFKTLLSLAK